MMQTIKLLHSSKTGVLISRLLSVEELQTVQKSVPTILVPQLTDTRSEMTFRPVPQGHVNGRVDFVERCAKG